MKKAGGEKMFKKDRSKRKNKKVLLFPSTPLEVSTLEAFFERMSEDGFLVTGAYGAFYFFEEAVPKKRKFYVDYFYKASSMDIGLAPATEDYWITVETPPGPMLSATGRCSVSIMRTSMHLA